jgi:hypothetical protein
MMNELDLNSDVSVASPAKNHANLIFGAIYFLFVFIVAGFLFFYLVDFDSQKDVHGVQTSSGFAEEDKASVDNSSVNNASVENNPPFFNEIVDEVEEVCIENLSCEWSECLDGVEEEVCVDLNNCTEGEEVVESRECEVASCVDGDSVCPPGCVYDTDDDCFEVVVKGGFSEDSIEYDDIDIVDDYLFASNAFAGFYVFDISNLYAVEKVGEFSYYKPSSFKIDKSRDIMFAVSSTSRTIGIFDISDPAEIFMIGSIDMDDLEDYEDLGGDVFSSQIDLVENYLFVGTNNLRIYDLEDLYDIKLAGSYILGPHLAENRVGCIKDFVLVGDFVFTDRVSGFCMPEDSKGNYLIDVSDKNLPVLVRDLAENVDVFYGGDFAYGLIPGEIFSGGNVVYDTVVVYDTSNLPNELVEIEEVVMPWHDGELKAFGEDYLLYYSLDLNVLFDVSQGTLKQVLYNFSVPNFKLSDIEEILEYDSDYYFALGGREGLLVLD